MEGCDDPLWRLRNFKYNERIQNSSFGIKRFRDIFFGKISSPLVLYNRILQIISFVAMENFDPTSEDSYKKQFEIDPTENLILEFDGMILKDEDTPIVRYIYMYMCICVCI